MTALFRRRPRRGGTKLRLMLALGMMAFALFSYCAKRDVNEITGEGQYVDLSPEQEVALGLQAAPQMAQQHGGLHSDLQARALVKQIGTRLIENTSASKSPYVFEFHLLADEQTVNAFALPGGQVFITAALMNRLETQAQLAGVLGHEAAHVVARHGAEHMAKAKLTQGLAGAAVLATSNGGQGSSALASLIGNMVNMKYGRDDELESDRLGVRFSAEAGYDPRAMVRVMEILAEASQGARPPEFYSTHPNPDRRIERIHEAIAGLFPNGVPPTLEP